MLTPGWLSKAWRYRVSNWASAIGSPSDSARNAAGDAGAPSASARAVGRGCERLPRDLQAERDDQQRQHRPRHGCDRTLRA